MTNGDAQLTGSDAREQLYDLLDEHLNRNVAIDRILEIGKEYLGVEHAHFTDIDVETDMWEVVASTDSTNDRFPEGTTADLGETYCRRTMEQSVPLAVHDANKMGWQDDLAYQLHELDTYLGVRIDVFDQPFGTLCFVSDAPRQEFSEAELIFVELASNILEQVLVRSYHESELANRDRAISVLNRVLRHNLRNDLNIVRGFAEMLQKQTDEKTAQMAGRIVETSDSLLSLANKARDFEALTRSVPVPRPMNVVTQVDSAVEEVHDEFPAMSITKRGPDEARALSAPQFETAISEILENAGHHAGSSPEVEIEIEKSELETVVRIEDDGPGLPSDERLVFESGEETPLEHGSGLGLFLVYWIVVNLEGDFEVDADSDGTGIGFRLPSVSD